MSSADWGHAMCQMRSRWYTYFNTVVEKADLSEEMINSDMQFTSLEYKKMREVGITPVTLNILYGTANKIINQILHKKTSVLGGNEEVEYYIRELLRKNQKEIEDVLKNLVVRGYASVLIYSTEKRSVLGQSLGKERKFRSLPSKYEAFFDPSSNRADMTDGAFCGYSVFYNKMDLADRYGQDVANKLTSSSSNSRMDTNTTVEIVYFFHREKVGDNITLYEIHPGVGSLKQQQLGTVMPMVFIPFDGYERRWGQNTQLKITPIGALNADAQRMYNKTMSLMLDNYKTFQYRFIAAKGTIPSTMEADYATGDTALLQYEPQNALEMKDSAPIPISPIPFPKDAAAVIQEAKASIADTWTTIAEVSTASKYDSFAVMSEKQRQAQSGVSTIIRSYERGLARILSTFVYYDSDALTPEVKEYFSKNDLELEIGEDAQRERLETVELYKHAIQYMQNVSPVATINLLRNMLDIFGTREAKILAEALAGEADSIVASAQKDRDGEIEQQKLQMQAIKAEIEFETEKLKSQTQIQNEKEKTERAFKLAAMDLKKNKEDK